MYRRPQTSSHHSPPVAGTEKHGISASECVFYPGNSTRSGHLTNCDLINAVCLMSIVPHKQALATEQRDLSCPVATVWLDKSSWVPQRVFELDRSCQTRHISSLAETSLLSVPCNRLAACSTAGKAIAGDLEADGVANDIAEARTALLGDTPRHGHCLTATRKSNMQRAVT